MAEAGVGPDGDVRLGQDVPQVLLAHREIDRGHLRLVQRDQVEGGLERIGAGRVGRLAEGLADDILRPRRGDLGDDDAVEVVAFRVAGTDLVGQAAARGRVGQAREFRLPPALDGPVRQQHRVEVGHAGQVRVAVGGDGQTFLARGPEPPQGLAGLRPVGDAGRLEVAELAADARPAEDF